MSALRISALTFLAIGLASCSEQATAPTPNFNQFVVNERVKTINDAIVRSTPSAFAAPVGSGTQLKNAQGAILASPGTIDVNGDNTRYWSVNFDTGVDGWVSGIYLTSVTEIPVSGHYVSPTGGTGLGDIANPWSLTYALSGAGGQLTAGETAWLRGGIYSGDFSTSLVGTSANPIVFRQYPGERATLDGRLKATTSSAYLTFWGFELTQVNPLANDGWYGIESYGVNLKYINLVIHDANKSGLIANWPNGDTEVYGSIMYNNGTHNNLDHGIYAQGTTGTMRLEHNVFFNNTSHGIHSYTESNVLRNVHAIGNVSFDNGSTANPTWGYAAKPNLIMGGIVAGATGMRADSNFLYNVAETTANMRLGFGSLDTDVTAIGNTIWGGNAALKIESWSSAQVKDNTLKGGPVNNRLVELNDATVVPGHVWTGNQYYATAAQTSFWYSGLWRTLASWHTATTLSNTGTLLTTPGTPTIFLKNNKYDPKRALLVVFNWPAGSSVNVDLSTFIASGPYEIRNVQNIFGSPVASGTYSGGTVSVPMTGTAPPPFVGHGWTITPPTTGPNFHAFIVTTP